MCKGPSNRDAPARDDVGLETLSELRRKTNFQSWLTARLRALNEIRALICDSGADIHRARARVAALSPAELSRKHKTSQHPSDWLWNSDLKPAWAALRATQEQRRSKLLPANVLATLCCSTPRICASSLFF